MVHWAAMQNNSEVLKYLENTDIDWNEKGTLKLPNKNIEKGSLPFHIAASENTFRTLKYLLERGHVDVNAATENNFSAAMIASWNNNIECLDIVIQHGAKLDQCENLLGGTVRIISLCVCLKR